jgi:hypothetical protein
MATKRASRVKGRKFTAKAKASRKSIVREPKMALRQSGPKPKVWGP